MKRLCQTIYSNSTLARRQVDASHLKSEQKWAMLGTSGQACRSLSVDILPDQTSTQPQTNPKSPNRIACSHTHSHLR